MDDEALTMIIVIPTMFAVTAWAFKTLLNFIQSRQLAKLHYSLQDKLLEKIGSSPEAVEYLRSETGEKLLAQLGSERTNPYQRILTALQVGAVISLLSIGFLFLRAALASAAAVGVAFAPGLWRMVNGAVGGLQGSDLSLHLPRAAGSPMLVLVASMVILGGLAPWELTAAPGN